MWPFQKHLDEAAQSERQVFRNGKMKFEVPPMCGLYQMQYHFDNEKPANAPASEEEAGPPLAAAQNSYTTLKKKMDKELLSGSEYIDHFSYLSISEADAFVCESCDVHIKTTRNTTAYQVVMRFVCPPALANPSRSDKQETLSNDKSDDAADATEEHHIPPWYSLFFPFSECGPKVESFQVQINKFPVFGEMVRARRRDGRLIPATEKAAFIAETSDLEEEKTKEDAANAPTSTCEPEEKSKGVAGANANEEGEAEPSAVATTTTPSSAAEAEKKPAKAQKPKPLLYYYVVDPIDLEQILQLRGPAAGQGEKSRTAEENVLIEVEVAWRCRVDQLQGNTVYVPFSFYCAPCRPQRLTCTVELDKDAPPLKEIKSPSCQQNLLYLNTRYLKERRAAHVAVETVTPNSSIASVLSDKEDLFLFIIQLGENSFEISEEISFFGITTIVIAVLLVVWFLLTKDLQF